MSLTPDEAAQSLANVETAQRRSMEAIGYSRSSPYLLTLGSFWTICFGATQFWPLQSGWVWISGMVFFMSVMILLGYRSCQEIYNERSRRISRNISIVFVYIVPAFAVAVIAVMWPVGGTKIGAFIPLIYAAVYTGMGLWAGQRYIIVGITVFIATLVGFYFLRAYFALWMAVFGGGSMILTGLWLRQA